jgi:hypothetical protein
MKKLMCLLLVVLSLSVQGQIKFKSSLEMGYENWGFDTGAGGVIRLRNNMFSAFNISAGYKGFNLYTDLKTFMTPVSIVSYRPNQTEYIIGLRYSIDRFELNAEHLCSHSTGKFVYQEFYDRVSIKINLIK